MSQAGQRLVALVGPGVVRPWRSSLWLGVDLFETIATVLNRDSITGKIIDQIAVN